MPSHSWTRHQQPRRPCQIVPHTGGGLLAARDVQSTVPPLPVERRRHEMPNAVPPCGPPGGISSLPVVRVPASLALPPCGAPVSDRGMCHSAQKIKGIPRVCRMRAATYIAVLPSVLGGSCLTALDLVSPITSKCTTCDHFKVHHFGWGISGGLRGGWQGANAFRGEVFQSARPRPLGPMR